MYEAQICYADHCLEACVTLSLAQMTAQKCLR